jgi:hypothetical protein
MVASGFRSLSHLEIAGITHQKYIMKSGNKG